MAGFHSRRRLAMVAFGLAGAVWSVPQLAGGAADIPRHWWSTMAVGPLLPGLALLAWTGWRRPAQG
ncbi:MAG: hypothetical protein ACRD12_03875 [Acidimicrobiales bacterium]